MGGFLPRGNNGIRAWHLQGFWARLRRRMWRCSLTSWPHPGHSLAGGKEEEEAGKLGSARSLSSQRLSGAVRIWAGTWFGIQWLPHPCRGKEVSKPNPGRSLLQMSKKLLLPNVSILKDIWNKLSIAKTKLVTGFFSTHAHTKSFHLEVIAGI